MNTIEYGSKSKLIGQFYGGKNLIQQFSTQLNTYLDSIQLFFYIYPNIQRDYSINVMIIDKEQNLYFSKKIWLGDVQKSGFYKILANVQLQMYQEYYLCIDSFQQGNNLNYVGLYIGYRKKFMNFFIDNKFSVGQLYCNFNYKDENKKQRS